MQDNCCVFFYFFLISTENKHLKREQFKSHMNKATMPLPSCKVSAFLKRSCRCSFACLEIRVESQVLCFTYVEHLMYFFTFLTMSQSLVFLSLVLLVFLCKAQTYLDPF